MVKKLKLRTIDDDYRAIATFERWRIKKKLPDDIHAITTKVAKTFAEDLATFEGNLEAITCSKYVTRLR